MGDMSGDPVEDAIRVRAYVQAAATKPDDNASLEARAVLIAGYLRDGYVSVDEALPAHGECAQTWRFPEKGTNRCHCVRWPDGDVEWVETASGVTTITHGTFLPPTHWRPLGDGDAKLSSTIGLSGSSVSEANEGIATNPSQTLPEGR